MPDQVSNHFLGRHEWAALDVRVLLLRAGYVHNPDHDYLVDCLNDPTATEVAGTGYARKVVSGKSVQVSDTADEARFLCDTVIWDGANFGEVGGMLFYENQGGDDAASRPIHYLEAPNPPGPVTTNGTRFQWQFPNGYAFKMKKAA